MRVFLLRTMLVFLIAFTVVEAASFLLIDRLRYSNFYKPGVAYNNKNSKYDYVVLGSSRGLTTIDTKQVDEAIGTKGYNFSMDDTGIQTQKLTLQHLISSRVQFRYLVLAYDIIRSDSESSNKLRIGENDHRFLPFIDKPYVYNHFKNRIDNGGQFYVLNRIFPFLGLGYFNVELLWPSVFASIDPNYRFRSDLYGNYSYPFSVSNNSTSLAKEIANLDMENQILKQILEICKKNEIKLILFFAPHQNISIEDNQTKRTSKDFVVYNYSDSIVDPIFFYDFHHVNSKGRKSLTEFFINDFSQSLSMTLTK